MKTRIKNLLPLLLLLGLPGVVQAQFAYSTNADGSANIVAYAGPPWVVTIPTNINGLTVTTIGTNAFENDYSLTSVSIPNSVTSIGEDAFALCYSLTNVTIGNSVTNIGEGAFYYCYSLTSVTIPGSVTSIGDSAFDACSSLTNVMIPDSLTSIGEAAFDSCTHLTNVTIPNSVTSIGDFAFYYCPSLTSVTIPSNVTSIGDSAFADCSGLTNVTIPNSVTSIGDFAFSGCSLTSITIPNNVTSIGDGAFDDSGLTNIAVNAANPYYASVGGVLFDKSLDTLLEFPGGLAGSYAIPNSVTSIGDYAFESCFSLTSVTIPNSVTSMGVAAFNACTSLTSVTIPNSVTSIVYGAFEDCTSLTSVYFTGNAPFPPNYSTVFYGDPATVYYLPGTTGWGAFFDGRPTAPWFLPNPVILNNSVSFGVQPGGFGFTISWATNASIVVEAATNLAHPVWIPVSTSPLIGGTNYFSDPQWTNYPMRFYRAALAFTVGGTLTGLPAGDTVTLQDNGSDNLTLSNNGTFTFPTALPNGHAYSVTVSGTSRGTSILTAIYSPVTANGSGTISGANVMNVAVQCTPIYTGNLGVDMYNAAVADGTAHGGVPAVMVTNNGGPFRVTAPSPYSYEVALIYQGSCQLAVIEGTTSCSSTTLPSGSPVIQFGTALACGQTFGYGY
jgi:BspA type Leucine rich repeat region (6 copies)